MIKTKIIELAEAGSDTQNIDNGDYRVYLKDRVQINKGDQVTIKNVFVDNLEGGSQRCLVKPDPQTSKFDGVGTKELAVTFGYYYNDWGSTRHGAFDNKIFTPLGDMGDGTKPAATAPVHTNFSGLSYALNVESPKDAPDTPPAVDTIDTFQVKVDRSKIGPYINGKHTAPGTLMITFTTKNLIDVQGKKVPQVRGHLILFDTTSTGPTPPGKLTPTQLINKYINADGVITFSQELEQEMLKDGFMASAGPFAEQGFMPFSVPKLPDGTQDPNPMTFKIPDGKDDDLFPAGNKYLDPNFGSGGVSFTRQVTQGHDRNFSAYTERFPFKITAGSYQPSDLAEEISRKLGEMVPEYRLTEDPATRPNLDNLYTFSENPLMPTVRQLMNQEPFVNGLPPTPGHPGVPPNPAAGTHDHPTPVFFAKESDGTNTGFSSFSFTTSKIDPNGAGGTPGDANKAGGPNYLLGTSNFGLTYDPEHDKFTVAQLHNSLYNSVDSAANNTGIPEVRVGDVTTGPAQNVTSKRYYNKCGGIFITALEPDDLAGAEPFWMGEDSVLKFSKDLKVVPSRGVGKSSVAHENINNRFYFDYVSNLSDGVNVTGDVLGPDDLVTKKCSAGDGFKPANAAATPPVAVQNNGNCFDEPPQFDTIEGRTEARFDSQQNFPIVAQNTVTPANDASLLREQGGYFKIELDMGINNNVVEQDRTNPKIFDIMSRFYQQDSYTSDQGAGAIPYIHTDDEPAYISDVGIRILKPNGEIADKLGRTSCVFLEIVKSAEIEENKKK